MLPALGWRNSYFLLGVVGFGVVILLNLFVVKTKPSEMGLYPDGDAKPAEAAAAVPNQGKPQGLTQKEALATPTLWLIGIGLLTFSIPMVGALQNQVPHLNDLGFNMALAAGALGVVGLMGGVSKFIFGWLCDFVHVKVVTLIGFSLQLIAVMILTFVIEKDSSPVMIYAYAVLFGLGAGCWMPLMSMLTGKYFGMAAFGSIFGILMLFQQVGSAAGPLVAGILFDMLGSYSTVFKFFIAMSGLSILLMVLVKPPRQAGIK
jgi:sugar phosphate permease